MRGSFAESCRRIVDSDAFTYFVAAVILANAVVLGLETYDEIERDVGGTLNLLNDVFLGIFVVELLMRFFIRIIAPGRSWDSPVSRG